MSTDNDYFMRAALEMARIGLERGELPIGAVVVLNGEIIASAHTQEVEEGRLLVHAELLALEMADKIKPFPGRRRDVQLFVTGEPCLMCLGAAMSFFMGKFTMGMRFPVMARWLWCRGGDVNTEDFPNYQVPRIEGGLFRAEGIALFQEYVRRHQSGAMWAWAKTIARL